MNPKWLPLQAGIANELVLVGRWAAAGEFSKRVFSLEGGKLVDILDFVEFQGAYRTFSVVSGFPAFIYALISGGPGAEGTCERQSGESTHVAEPSGVEVRVWTRNSGAGHLTLGAVLASPNTPRMPDGSSGAVAENGT